MGLELSASVSSLHLEEASPLNTSPTFTLGAWSVLRKASAPFSWMAMRIRLNFDGEQVTPSVGHYLEHAL